jgi:hypothetical protein
MKKIDLITKQTAFLRDTIEHYNLNNRGIHENGACRYYPSQPNTEGCAIGRKLPTELQLELDEYGCMSGVASSNVFNKLPDNLKELGQSFLSKIQGLHDTQGNWNEEGLSSYGKLSVDLIIKNFELTIPLFKI